MSDKLLEVVTGIRSGKYTNRVDLSSAGLDQFPHELFEIADTLEILNLGNNRIKSLPSGLERLTKLRVLFFGQNEFECVPAELSQLRALTMVSFKSNRVAAVHEDALSPSINWLILSDNRIEGMVHMFIESCDNHRLLFRSTA